MCKSALTACHRLCYLITHFIGVTRALTKVALSLLFSFVNRRPIRFGPVLCERASATPQTHREQWTSTRRLLSVWVCEWCWASFSCVHRPTIEDRTNSINYQNIEKQLFRSTLAHNSVGVCFVVVGCRQYLVNAFLFAESQCCRQRRRAHIRTNTRSRNNNNSIESRDFGICESEASRATDRSFGFKKWLSIRTKKLVRWLSTKRERYGDGDHVTRSKYHISTARLLATFENPLFTIHICDSRPLSEARW